MIAMNTETKLLTLRNIIKNKKNRVFVRFRTKESYITGLLQNLDINDDDKIRCVFSGNGRMAAKILNLDKNELYDVVVFNDENLNPIFFKDFESENKYTE